MRMAEQNRGMLSVLLLILLWADFANGQSIFGFREEGAEMLIGDAHMAALGYGEIPGTVSSTQCGSIAFLKSAGVDISYLGTRLEMSDDAGKNTMHYYGIPFIKVATSLPRDFSFGFNVHKTTDFNSNFIVAPDSVNGVAYQETFLKRGQLSMGNVELAKRISSNMGVGMGLNVLFGGSEEVWMTDFQDATYRDTRDSLKSSYFGMSYNLGFALSAKPFSIAAGYQFPVVCEKSTRSLSYLRPDTTLSENELRFPGQMTIGGDVMIGENVNIIATVRYRDWSNLTVNGVKRDGYQNVISYSIGFEYKRSKGYKQREIPFRMGYFYKPWYFRDSYDEQIVDHGITLGSSIPVIRKDGFLDIALIGGWRKTGELDERFYGVQLGFNFYERW
jgi:hypothetical protein